MISFIKSFLGLVLFVAFCTVTSRIWANPLLPPTSRHALRDGDPILTLAPRTERNFAEEAVALAHQGKATFVVEGVPLHPILTPKTGAEVAATDAPFPKALQTGSLGECVQNLANAFDYDLIRAENLFLFKKRYTDPQDLPCVTLEETQNALHDVRNFLQSNTGNLPVGGVGDDPIFGAFLTSFSFSQLELLKQARLPVASLRPEQQEQMRRYAITTYTEDPLAAANAVLSDLNAVLEKRGVFKRSVYNRDYVFSYQYGSLKKRGVLPISTIRGSRRTSYGILYMAEERDLSKPFSDPTDPTEEDNKLAEQERKHPAQTLQSIVNLLNAKAQPHHLRLESGLNDKPLSLYGMESNKPDAVWEAIALLYNLRVIADPENPEGLLLTYKKTRIPHTLEDLGPCVLQALPTPYVRALHWDDMVQGRKEAQERGRRVKAEREAAAQRGQSVPPLSPQQAEEKRKVVAEWDANWQRWGSATESVRIAATRRFRASVEPKAKMVPNDAGLPVSDLSTEEKQSLATVLMGLAANDLYSVAGVDMPHTLTRFNDLVLKGGPFFDEGEKVTRFELQVGFLQPDGSFNATSGFATSLPQKKP